MQQCTAKCKCPAYLNSSFRSHQVTNIRWGHLELVWQDTLRVPAQGKHFVHDSQHNFKFPQQKAIMPLSHSMVEQKVANRARATKVQVHLLCACKPILGQCPGSFHELGTCVVHNSKEPSLRKLLKSLQVSTASYVQHVHAQAIHPCSNAIKGNSFSHGDQRVCRT